MQNIIQRQDNAERAINQINTQSISSPSIITSNRSRDNLCIGLSVVAIASLMASSSWILQDVPSGNFRRDVQNITSAGIQMGIMLSIAGVNIYKYCITPRQNQAQSNNPQNTLISAELVIISGNGSSINPSINTGFLPRGEERGGVRS